MKKKKIRVEVGSLISITPGKKHAWYESNVGKIKKPLPPKP